MVFVEMARRDTAADLRLLADQVAAGELDTGVSLTTSWTEADEALAALVERRISGKAVLTVD